jgi:hypothetical protein
MTMTGYTHQQELYHQLAVIHNHQQQHQQSLHVLDYYHPEIHDTLWHSPICYTAPPSQHQDTATEMCMCMVC